MSFLPETIAKRKAPVWAWMCPRHLVYSGYVFVHIIGCLFCSFIFVCWYFAIFFGTEHLCKYFYHWIFLRRTVNKSHLSFTSTGQAIIYLFLFFPDLKRPAVDLQGSTASHWVMTESKSYTFFYLHYLVIVTTLYYYYMNGSICYTECIYLFSFFMIFFSVYKIIMHYVVIYCLYIIVTIHLYMLHRI